MKKWVLAITIILGAAVPSTQASATSFVQKLIVATAERYGVPKFLALKVAKVESSFTCDAEGKAGELGPLQTHDRLPRPRLRIAQLWGGPGVGHETSRTVHSGGRHLEAQSGARSKGQESGCCGI